MRRGNGHQHLMAAAIANGSHCRPHGNARRQPVIDHDHRAPAQIERPAASAQFVFAAGNLGLGRGHAGPNLALAELNAGEHRLIQAHGSVERERAKAHFGVPGQCHLRHDGKIERHAQAFSDRNGDRNASGWNGEHAIDARVVLGKQPGDAGAGMRTVPEYAEPVP